MILWLYLPDIICLFKREIRWKTPTIRPAILHKQSLKPREVSLNEISRLRIKCRFFQMWMLSWLFRLVFAYVLPNKVMWRLAFAFCSFNCSENTAQLLVTWLVSFAEDPTWRPCQTCPELFWSFSLKMVSA